MFIKKIRMYHFSPPMRYICVLNHKILKKYLLILSILFFYNSVQLFGSHLVLEMNANQSNHLKAYGIAYWCLQRGVEVDWLLNYEGGSFGIVQNVNVEAECRIRGVSYAVVTDAAYNGILRAMAQPDVNMDLVKLEKMPKIAVYSPKTKQPWDDAVTLALTYAEIPYEIVFDDEVMQGKLPLYDWLHLHHEDFTGQYGRFYAGYRTAAWYKAEVAENEMMAKKWGFSKVSQLKLSVSKQIRDFTAGGGFLFAMCSAADTYDIALASEGLDICENMFDGDGVTPNYNKVLDFSKTFAFKDFTLSQNPYEYEHSTIDVSNTRRVTEPNDFFSLFEFSAKWDPVPTMLCQNHEQIVKGFYGQTTAFNKNYLRSEVLVMGENKVLNEARYVHGEFGKGTWTFYSGHDPEDYQHQIGEPPTDLALHPDSPGYRLILNNVLFPAAKKKKQKT